MEKVKFSENWNGGKLNLHHFTTIRYDSSKFVLNSKVEIWHKETHLGNAQVLSITNISLAELEKKDTICYLDTGYNGTKTRAMMELMYKKFHPEPETMFAVILLKMTDRFAFIPHPNITENTLF